MTGQPCPPDIRRQLRADQAPVLHIACPHCQAVEGQPCRSTARGRRLHQAHAARYLAAGIPTQLTAEPRGAQ